MATIHFDSPAIRNPLQEDPLNFQWPRGGSTFTYQFSLDMGGTWENGNSIITNTGLSEPYTYQIPYHENERPDNLGFVLFLVDDGTDSGRIVLQVVSGVSPVLPPDYPLGSVLTSLAEMERVLSVEGIEEHTSDVEDNTLIISELTLQATEEVLMYLRDRYDIEDLANSPWVRRRATMIACYMLSIRKGNPSYYGDDYAKALIDIEMARDGEINIGLATSNRAVVQTPMLDQRHVQTARINPLRSSQLFGREALPYRVSDSLYG